jgi:hypothetical protein
MDLRFVLAWLERTLWTAGCCALVLRSRMYRSITHAKTVGGTFENSRTHVDVKAQGTVSRSTAELDEGLLGLEGGLLPDWRFPSLVFRQ